MRNRKFALFLSFLYCVFAPMFKLTLLARTVWPLLWVVGMADAYIDGTMSFRRRSHIKKWALLILPGVIISTLVFYIQMRPEIYRMMGWQEASAMRQNVSSQSSVSTGFYSIQVGAFVDREKAEKLRDELLEKEYSAVVERQKGSQRRWYHVYVGKFQTQDQAIVFGDKLREQEGRAYMLVQRNVTGSVTEEEAEKENDKPLEKAEDQDQGP